MPTTRTHPLREARRQAGLTLAGLALRTGAEPDSLRRVEDGRARRVATPRTLPAIEALGLDPVALQADHERWQVEQRGPIGDAA